MRRLLKHFIIDTTSLYLISQAVGGMRFANGGETLVLAGAALMLVTLVVKPIINILLLPINLVTFGLFKWVAFTITLYFVTLIVTGFKIVEFNFVGFNSYWFSLPPIVLSGILAFIAFSFLLSFVSSIVYWIFH
jgi:putative membrane protein